MGSTRYTGEQPTKNTGIYTAKICSQMFFINVPYKDTIGNLNARARLAPQRPGMDTSVDSTASQSCHFYIFQICIRYTCKCAECCLHSHPHVKSREMQAIILVHQPSVVLFEENLMWFSKLIPFTMWFNQGCTVLTCGWGLEESHLVSEHWMHSFCLHWWLKVL